MVKKLTSLLFLLVVSSSIFAIGNSDTLSSEKEEKVYGPNIGLGVGVLKFNGDVGEGQFGNILIGNFGYDLHLKQRINSFLTGKFYVLFGTLSANERGIDRNLNFESSITTGGFSVEYDFNHFLPERRFLSPFLSLGVESFNFNSKTDLFDRFGNEYNYWSDGTIRNLPENSLNSAEAITIQRDYIYETDLRESNFDGKGSYPERSFAIPFGVGAVMHLSRHIDFTVGTTIHYTFTDLIDNVDDQSSGDRLGNLPGNSANDKFWLTSFSLSYDFMKHEDDEINPLDAPQDYSIYADQDEDEDGVNDFVDQCPWTPLGTEVDLKGCPLDDDKDLVANYRDEELQTPLNVPVNQKGIELTDDMIYEGYQKYLDSTGAFSEYEVVNRYIKSQVAKKRKYKVQIGEYTEAIDGALVDKFLSIPDVEITSFGDSLTVIVVGDYDNLPDAVKRKIRMNQEGYDGAVVVKQGKNGLFDIVNEGIGDYDIETSEINSAGLVFRIQLGAFSVRLPETSFNGLKNIAVVKVGGLYKYLYKGSFKTMESAASTKINIAIDYGVQDAFIVAYKDGKRISLKEAGVDVDPVVEEENTPEDNKVYDKSNIKFQVQIGSYKDLQKSEVLSKFKGIENINQRKIENGVTRYTSGNFDSYEAAAEYRNELIIKGFGGVFIIALDGEELIPVGKAKSILGQ